MILEYDYIVTTTNKYFTFQNVSKEEDPFVPTSEDLAGFWDMVHIQV